MVRRLIAFKYGIITGSLSAYYSCAITIQTPSLLAAPHYNMKWTIPFSFISLWGVATRIISKKVFHMYQIKELALLSWYETNYTSLLLLTANIWVEQTSIYQVSTVHDEIRLFMNFRYYFVTYCFIKSMSKMLQNYQNILNCVTRIWSAKFTHLDLEDIDHLE